MIEYGPGSSDTPVLMNLIHHIIDIKQSQGMSGVSEYKGKTATGTQKDGQMNEWKEDEWTDKDRNRSV